MNRIKKIGQSMYLSFRLLTLHAVRKDKIKLKTFLSYCYRSEKRETLIKKGPQRKQAFSEK